MRVHRAELRRRQVRRRRAAAAGLLAALLIGGVAVAQVVAGGDSAAAPVSSGGGSSQASGGGAGSSGQGATEPASTAPAEPKGTVTISAVGDTMLGTVGSLAPSPSTYFDAVKPAIAANVAFANLEGTLTDQTSGKCASLPAGACYEFRVPPSWARYFKRAGFTIMSNGNNHAFDFWQAGLDDTVAALDRAGLKHTGRTTEITYLRSHGITLAFIGCGPYPNTGPLNDYTALRRLIHRADARAQIVVVAMHAGAEGTGATHLTGQDEIYFDENRGNPIAFAHTAIDAGADLVLGSGPHVLRAMEFYKGRLIAYSLGNFAGYKMLQTGGTLSTSGVLKVTLKPDGTYVGATLSPTTVAAPGLPKPDPKKAAISLIESLSKADFPQSGAKLAKDGSITP
jgi:Bacterial capsule synthesis protein PGA_cap